MEVEVQIDGTTQAKERAGHEKKTGLCAENKERSALRRGEIGAAPYIPLESLQLWARNSTHKE